MEYNLSEKFSGVKIFSTEKSDGPMNYRLGGLKRLEKIVNCTKANIPLVSFEQTHGEKVIFVDNFGYFLKADGALCRGDFAVSTRSADCLPLMIFDRKNSIIGALHVSRKNLGNSIIKNFARILNENGGDIGSTVLFFGPHIRRKNCQISQSDASALTAAGFGSFVDDQKFFDLTEAVVFALEKEGFLRENIDDCEINTFESDNFYSYRRDCLGLEVNVFATVILKTSK